MHELSTFPTASPVLGLSGATLTIDLTAVVANWRRLAAEVAPAACAAVVKADAYGLGAPQVAGALLRAGCRFFFVAHAEEGIALRASLGPVPVIAVLHGSMPGGEGAIAEHDLVPVLSAPWQVAGWAALARRRGARLPAILQVDSGMTRFGLSPEAFAGLDPQHLAAFDLRLVMSHLACADEPDSAANDGQREAFLAACRSLPGVPRSLAASSGIFLGPRFHLDGVRPGAALYGIAPRPGIPNPMQPVVRLSARVVQLRDVPAGTAVGYGRMGHTARPSRLATLAVGYADGFLRSLSNRGAAWRDGVRLPVVGRVSMDSIVVDVTDLGDGGPGPGDAVDLLGPDQDVDALARDAGTIGYEILTSLGGRFGRHYLEA